MNYRQRDRKDTQAEMTDRQKDTRTDTTNIDGKYRRTEKTVGLDIRQINFSVSLCPFFSKIKDQRSKWTKSLTKRSVQ